MSNVAVIGAGGFIGSRITEIFHLTGVGKVRPVVRQIAGLARSARFNMEGRVADATNRQSMRTAIEGCEFVVDAVGGDTTSILNTVEPLYRAAEDAGVRRIVYLSTASVHGQSPAAGTDETSLLQVRQPFPYNRAKILAERKFAKLRTLGRVEVVMLRPGIVWGPRSSWIGGFATDLLTGKAYLVEGASGVCNSVYVDNLVHAVLLAMNVPAADRNVFLVGDREAVTWRNLYAPIAQAFGTSLEEIPSVPAVRDSKSAMDRIMAFRDTPSVQAILPALPERIRYTLFMGISAFLNHRPAPTAFDFAPEAVPTADLERTLLHRCAWRLPWTKAASVLGYDPVVSFAEGCRRSIEWLKFAGYPVSNC